VCGVTPKRNDELAQFLLVYFAGQLRYRLRQFLPDWSYVLLPLANFSVEVSDRLQCIRAVFLVVVAS
jgi:hypothetical protein